MCYHMNDNRRPYTGDHYSPSFSQRNGNAIMQLWYRTMEQELNDWYNETPDAPYPKEGKVYFARRAFPFMPPTNDPACMVCKAETRGLSPYYRNLCADCGARIDVMATSACVCPEHIFTRISQCFDCKTSTEKESALLTLNKQRYAKEIAALRDQIHAFLNAPQEGL